MKEFLLGPGGAVILLTLVGVAVLVWYNYASKWPERVFAPNPTAEELRNQGLMPKAGAAVDTSAAEGSAGRGVSAGGVTYYSHAGQSRPIGDAAEFAQAAAQLEASGGEVVIAPREEGGSITDQIITDGTDGDGRPD